MICFTERKNKQVQYNTEQSYSLIDDALYINNRCRLKNLDVSSNVFRAQRWNIELCMVNAAVLTGGLQTAHVHPLQAPASDTGTATRRYLQANPHIVIAHSTFCCFTANRI